MQTLHKLKRSVKNIAGKFVVFDCETKGLRAKSDAFVFGVIYSIDFTKVIYSVADFKKEFLSPYYKNKICFAHSAEYDLNTIYDNIYKMDNTAIFNNKFIGATNGVTYFADSMNIFPASVKKVGEMLGLEKQKIERQFLTGREIKKVSQRMINYCVRDCEIIYNALIEIFSFVGNIKITLAGLSLDLFRRKYLKFHIDFNETLTEYFFNSYYGGRTECFYLGNTRAPVYDINSMYPFSMINTIFPNPKYLKKKINISPESFKSYFLKYFEGCAEIEIIHKDSYFGFLPFRARGKLLFPIGKLCSTWNFNEIRFALENKIIEIKKVNYIIYAEPLSQNPFTDFVTDLYNRRFKTKNKLHHNIYKLLLNSLYGKFAQRSKSKFKYIEDIEAYFSVLEQHEINGELIKIHPFSEIRKDVFLELKQDKLRNLYHCIPVFSSYITSQARITLLDFLIKYKNFNPVYCDTDSIAFEKKLKLNVSDKLGYWKLENKIITQIRGLKNYSYIESGQEKEKIKGVPQDAKKINDKEYQYENLVKTRESLRRNIEAGVLIKRKKLLRFVYDKREILNNGQTLPLKFGK